MPIKRKKDLPPNKVVGLRLIDGWHRLYTKLITVYQVAHLWIQRKRTRQGLPYFLILSLLRNEGRRVVRPKVEGYRFHGRDCQHHKDLLQPN